MGDTEIQHQRHRGLVFDEVSLYFDVSTVLTPVSNDLLCSSPMCSAEKVSELIYCPVMCLFGTRVGVTRANMVA